MNIGHSPLRRGLVAAAAALAVAGVSVAGAAQDVSIYVSDVSGTCFTTVPNKPACAAGERADVTVQTGDTVTWDFTGSTNVHNAAPVPNNGSTPPDAAWNARKPQLVPSGQDTWTFGKAGVYRFVCGAHPTMVGTVTVEGESVETPAPTPTATATATAVPTASPTPTATPDDHTSTPAPGHASVKDAEAPRLASASVKRVSAGVQLRFWLSEPATVTISAARKGSKKIATSATVHAAAGTRSMVLRSKAFKTGTYTVSFAPVDAMGNKGAATSKTLKVK